VLSHQKVWQKAAEERLIVGNLLSIVTVALYSLFLIVIIILMVRLILKHLHCMQATFFLFALISLLLSNLYWITFDILYPGIRMPFAANEIGEWAMFLLIGSSLVTSLDKSIVKFQKEMIFVSLFVAANTALWIVWTGEWLQDIFTGIFVAYFFCMIVIRIKYHSSLKRPEWLGLAFICLIVMFLQFIYLYVPVKYAPYIDIVSASLMILCILYCLAKTIVYNHDPNKKFGGNYLAFLGFTFSMITMYMSSGYMYLTAYSLSAVCIAFMYITVRKECDKA